MLAAVFLSACGSGAASPLEHEDGKLEVVATTTFVGDVVSRVGGEQINLTVLLPSGANPHAYQPSPQDVAAVNQADIIFANGVGLEVFLEDLIANAGGEAELVHVSEGADLRSFDGQNPDHEQEEETRTHEGADPHVWLDPTNVMIWVDNIQETLVRLDPVNEGRYQENAQAYRKKLEDLDSWIRDRVAEIPRSQRYLVTDHTVFGYFAEQYGFQQVGAVVPAATTEAEPSGKHLAELTDTIREYNVRAIFVGKDFDPSLSQRIAEDTGVMLVQLYFGSLTDEDGPAGTYIEYMRYNVEAIVGALAEEVQN